VKHPTDEETIFLTTRYATIKLAGALNNAPVFRRSSDQQKLEFLKKGQHNSQTQIPIEFEKSKQFG